METAVAARAKRALEPIHAMVYFVQEAAQEYAAAGIDSTSISAGAGYFASRAALLGAVGPGAVAATFYNFNPALVARHLPDVWRSAAPDAVVAARWRVADRALRRILGPEVLDSPEVAELTKLAKAAAEAAPVEGRALYAAHADLLWPDESHLVLWHAVTLLREFRGDGHVAALLGAELTGLEALITHTATGEGFTEKAARATRGWSAQEWAAGVAGLAGRGLLTADGALTAEGSTLRSAVEERTDRLAMAPWRHLGEDATERLITLAKPVSRQIAAAAFPPGVFGRR